MNKSQKQKIKRRKLAQSRNEIAQTCTWDKHENPCEVIEGMLSQQHQHSPDARSNNTSQNPRPSAQVLDRIHKTTWQVPGLSIHQWRFLAVLLYLPLGFFAAWKTWNPSADLHITFLSVILLGPVLILTGRFCQWIEPYQRMGTMLQLSGLNFLSGAMLLGLHPHRLASALSFNAIWCLICLIASAGVSWYVLKTLDRDIYMHSIWNYLPDKARQNERRR